MCTWWRCPHIIQAFSSTLTKTNQTVKNYLKASRFFLNRQQVYFLAPIVQYWKKPEKKSKVMRTYRFWAKITKFSWMRFFFFFLKKIFFFSWPLSLYKILKQFRVMKMCYFLTQNGPFAVKKHFLVKTTNISFMYLLAPFSMLNFLEGIQSYELAPSLGPCWSTCPKEELFWETSLILLHSVAQSGPLA